VFFFERKNQKTFGLWHTWPGERTRQRAKVFCFFSSEKKTFLKSYRKPNSKRLAGWSGFAGTGNAILRLGAGTHRSPCDEATLRLGQRLVLVLVF
jgi:hypothetical protein